MQITEKQWSEFMWAFWKFVKAYRPNETDNFDEALKAADKLMSKYSQPLFRAYVMGFLEQKSFEAIRDNN